MGKVIHYTESFRNWLGAKRDENTIARILYRAYQKDDDLCTAEDGIRAYDLMLTTDEIDYITFRNNGNISFLPAGKPHLVNDDGTWQKEGRQEGKPGKVIRKLFTKNGLKVIPAKEFETFTNSYKATFNDSGYVFAVYGSSKIPGIYNLSEDEVLQGGASLNGSCMNGEGVFLDLYVKCEQLKIITLHNRDGLLCGRALLWNLGEGINFMDRIYVSNDFMYDMFLTYADNNNLWRKEFYKSFDNKNYFVSPEGVSVNRVFTINTPTDFECYPYIDTFSYGGDGYITNNKSGNCYTYNETGGSREGEDDDDDDEGGDYDEINDERIGVGEAICVERGRYRGQWTHIDNTVEVNGNTWWNRDDDIVHLSWDGEWYETDEVVWSERDQEDYPINDCRQIYNGYGWVLKEDTVRDHNGDWQHKDDCTLLDNGEYAIEDDWVETHDGRKILEIYSIEVDGKIYHEDDAEAQPDYSAPTEVLCKYLAPFEKPNVNQLKFELHEQE